MKVFEHPNLHNDWKCPICKTNDDKQVTLIAIHGTAIGNNIAAEQVHINCIDLTIVKDIDVDFMVQRIK